MNNEPKICPLMSNKLNYQYCIDDCNFYDEYVGCWIKFFMMETLDGVSNIENLADRILRRDK